MFWVFVCCIPLLLSLFLLLLVMIAGTADTRRSFSRQKKDERMSCASPINEDKLPAIKFASEQLPAHQPREGRHLGLFH